MRIAVFDAWAGVAGDMWVGALLDAGVPLAPLAAAVASLPLPGVALRAERVQRGGLSGTHFVVQEGAAPAEATGLAFAPLAGAARGPLLPAAAAHAHRSLAAIEALLRRAAVPDWTRDRALAVFRALGEVEAAAHGVPVEQVHFHEVGAVDTIVDILCACYATELLGVDRIVANGIAVGAGTVRAAHGLLPVPAPATAALLRGIPVRHGGPAGERTTPTGAALLRVLAHGFDEPVALRAAVIGYGAGTRDTADVPNLLRVTVGDAVAPTSPTALVELQCQVDTATGEQLAWLIDAALQRGAVDAFVTPVQMKKGRSGALVTVLAEPARAAELTGLLLEEAGTLGVRRHLVERSVLERWVETRATALGPVQCKVARLPSGAVVVRPEADEVARLCRELGLGRAEVLRRLGPLG